MRVDNVARTVGVTIDYLDAGGVVIDSEQRQLSGAQIDTWISNQEGTILTRYLALIGVSGTVA